MTALTPWSYGGVEVRTINLDHAPTALEPVAQ